MRCTISWRVEALLVCGIVATTSGIAASPDGALPRQGKPSTTATEPVVTAVSGSSWLNHLGILYRDTSLGRGSGRYGPGAANEPAAHQPLVLPQGRSVELTGEDLYRLNCQACHGAEGTGAQPDVRSVLPMVQGSSFQAMQQKLRLERQAGADALARKQADQMKRDLYTRIKHGGQKMPALTHMNDSEIDMLYDYLTELAGTPDARPLTRKTVSWDRVGENLVKGTCHICHDAVGPRPSNQARLNGGIPPLSVLMTDKSVVDFVNKVRSGAPVTMGDLPMHYRGQMPVFYYLKDYEAAAAYLFLTDYPPRGE
jgi:mono/diheme cytochrome c family protein